MKILVFGAGVLGCNLANDLFRAGKDVTLLACGKWAQEIQENGLRIMSALNRDLKTFFDETGAQYPVWKTLEKEAGGYLK